jgi:hypothetical protein
VFSLQPGKTGVGVLNIALTTAFGVYQLSRARWSTQSAREARLDYAWLCLIIARLLAFARVLSRGRAYCWFASYLLADVIRDATLFFLRGRSTVPVNPAYAWVWILGEPVLLALLVCSAFELVAKIPPHYRGFGNYGRAKLRMLLQLAIAAALLSSIVEAHAHPWSLSVQTWLPLTITTKRLLTSALAAYLLFIAAWLSRVPVPMQPNLLRHASLFAAYLSLEAGVTLWNMLFEHGRGAAGSNLVLTIGTCSLFLLWSALLTKEGEQSPERKVLSPEETSEIHQREEQLNAALEQARRRLDR